MPLTWYSRDNLMEDHNYYRQPIPVVLTPVISSAHGRSKIKDVINSKLKRWTEALFIKNRTAEGNTYCLPFWLVTLKDS